MEDELYYFIDAAEDSELPDGAWWQVLEDAAIAYNKENGTNHNPCGTVHKYIQDKRTK